MRKGFILVWEDETVVLGPLKFRNNGNLCWLWSCCADLQDNLDFESIIGHTVFDDFATFFSYDQLLNSKIFELMTNGMGHSADLR